MDFIRKNWSKILVVVFVITILIFVIKPFDQNKQPSQILSTKIEECWNTGFGWSKMYTPIEKQKACALVTLANAEPIEITKTKIGDTPISIIKAFASSDFDSAKSYQSAPLKTTLKECLDGAESNAGTSGCLHDVEESLQRKIRSMVLLQIKQEKEMSSKAYDTDPELFTEELTKYWQNWYISTTAENSTKAKECEIEGTKSFGASGWYQVVPECYIQHDANEILWLLKQKEERKTFFEKRWDEIIKSDNRLRRSSDPDIVSFIIEGKKYSLDDVKTLSLPDGKTFYFGMPDYEFGPNCGSGGCDYLSFVGDNLNNLKKVTGYDKYYLDCDSNKISFSPDTSGEVFGSSKLDIVNRTIKIYYHLSANLGTENIYYIGDGGYPKLIASYDNTCSDKTVTLFRDSNFPSNLTEF